MDKNTILQSIYQIGIVPVVKLNKAEDAVPLGQALMKGGLPCAEVTFRTACAREAIAAMAKAFPDMLIGAGTVLTTEQVDEAVAAGAKFIVSPGFNPKVVQYCLDKNVLIIPGINNPSGIEQALEMGLDTVKFFPAEQSGGLEMIKAMSAPYGKMKFMPTGGINPKNMLSYLANPKILACGGSWMVNGDLIEAGRFDEIEKLCREAVSLMLGFGIRHTAINCGSGEETLQLLKTLGAIFNLPIDGDATGGMVGDIIEVLGPDGRGKYGHIAIATNSVDRAVYQLSRQGITFDESGTYYFPDGRRRVSYFNETFGGFAFHLIQK